MFGYLCRIVKLSAPGIRRDILFRQGALQRAEKVFTRVFGLSPNQILGFSGLGDNPDFLASRIRTFGLLYLISGLMKEKSGLRSPIGEKSTINLL